MKKTTKGVITVITEPYEYKFSSEPSGLNEFMNDINMRIEGDTFEGRMMINKDGKFKVLNGEWVECDEDWMPINKKK